MPENFTRKIPSDVLLKTVKQMKDGQKPSADDLMESLYDAMLAITNFAAVTTDLKTVMGKILAAHANKNRSALNTALDEAIKTYIEPTEINVTLH